MLNTFPDHSWIEVEPLYNRARAVLKHNPGDTSHVVDAVECIKALVKDLSGHVSGKGEYIHKAALRALLLEAGNAPDSTDRLNLQQVHESLEALVIVRQQRKPLVEKPSAGVTAPAAGETSQDSRPVMSDAAKHFLDTIEWHKKHFTIMNEGHPFDLNVVNIAILCWRTYQDTAAENDRIVQGGCFGPDQLDKWDLVRAKSVKHANERNCAKAVPILKMFARNHGINPDVLTMTQGAGIVDEVEVALRAALPSASLEKPKDSESSAEKFDLPSAPAGTVKAGDGAAETRANQPVERTAGNATPMPAGPSSYGQLSEMLVEIYFDGKHKGDDVAGMTMPPVRSREELEEGVCCAVCTLTKMTPELWQELRLPQKRFPWLQDAIDVACRDSPNDKATTAGDAAEAQCAQVKAGDGTAESDDGKSVPTFTCLTCGSLSDDDGICPTCSAYVFRQNPWPVNPAPFRTLVEGVKHVVIDDVNFVPILALAESVLAKARQLADWSHEDQLDETGVDLLLQVAVRWLALESALEANGLAGLPAKWVAFDDRKGAVSQSLHDLTKAVRKKADWLRFKHLSSCCLLSLAPNARMGMPHTAFVKRLSVAVHLLRDVVKSEAENTATPDPLGYAYAIGYYLNSMKDQCKCIRDAIDQFKSKSGKGASESELSVPILQLPDLQNYLQESNELYAKAIAGATILPETLGTRWLESLNSLHASHLEILRAVRLAIEKTDVSELDYVDFNFHAGEVQALAVDNAALTPATLTPALTAPANPALSKTAAAALAIIRAKQGQGLVAKEIISALAQKDIRTAESTFRKHIVPQLKAHGVDNDPARGGYYDTTCVRSM